MLARAPFFGALLLLVVSSAEATTAQGRLHGNPIRRVVTMLQEMGASVEKEGDTEKELYDKFMCYCTKTGESLDASIEAGASKISELEAQVEEDVANKARTDQEITGHKADREEARKSMAQATSMREREASDFATSSGEMKSNIQAMSGALSALKQGLSAALLQTNMGATLRNIVEHTPLVGGTEREVLLGFLQGQSQMEGGGTDQILGIVETMKEEMESDLKEATKAEADAKESYAELMKAKGEENAAATTGVETKTARSGDLAVSLASGRADLEASKESLTDDTAMRANLDKSCKQKTAEFAARSKTRAEEVLAISETVKILNADDSLDLFKKTLPGAPAALAQQPMMLVQTGVRSRSQLRRLRSVVSGLVAKDPTHKAALQLILLQTRSSRSTSHAKTEMGNFEHIVVMIDNMIKLLEQEQDDDDKKKEFCTNEIRKAGDDKEETEGNIKSLGVALNEVGELIETAESEIAALKQGIADLDTGVAQATDQRKMEHSEFSTTSAANMAAVELLDMAKNRMNKFYNPSMHKPVAPTEAPLYGLFQQGPVLVQVSSHSRLRQPDPAQLAFAQYQKSQASGGIIQMLDGMIKDVEADMAEAKRDEADAQGEYEEAMADATAKRATDSKLIVAKEAQKAELSAKQDDAMSDQGDANRLLKGLVTKIADLHSTCDFVLENYDFRLKARGDEISGLHEGKAVLSSGNMGFLQQF